MVSRRNEKQKGPQHKKNDISLQTFGQDGRGWRRRGNKKSFMCLINPPVSICDWSEKIISPFCGRLEARVPPAPRMHTGGLHMEYQELSAWRSNIT